MAGLSDDDIAAWVADSCAAQGVPVKITDPEAVRRVGVLMRAADAPRPAAKLRPVRRPASQPPLGHDPGRIEPVDTGSVHDSVIEHGADDGSLTVEVQSRPLGA